MHDEQTERECRREHVRRGHVRTIVFSTCIDGRYDDDRVSEWDRTELRVSRERQTAMTEARKVTADINTSPQISLIESHADGKRKASSTDHG